MSFRAVSRFGRYSLAGLLLASPVAGAAQQAGGTSRAPEITQLTVDGVHAVEASELLKHLAISESRCASIFLKPICVVTKAKAVYRRAYLDPDELGRDVLRARVFYFLRGYRAAVVDTIVERFPDHTAHVTLRVTEGPPTTITAVTVEQTTPVLSARAVRRQLSVRSEQPLDLIRLDTTRVQLQRRLWDEGYADAVIDTAIAIDTSVNRATVTLTVDPRWRAVVASIEVEGLDKIDTSTIFRSLSFKPGDLFRREDVLKSQRSLYESNLFRRAAISVPEADDSLKHVLITVQEAPPRETRIAAGFNTIDFIQVDGRYTNYNWFGNARRLNLQATIGNLFARQLNGSGIFYKSVRDTAESKYFAPTFTASMEFRRPWFLSPANELSLGIFAHRRSSPGIYVDRGLGLSGTFTRTLTVRAPMSLNYRFEVTNVDAGDVYFCVNFGVCDGLTLAALRKNQRLSPLALSASIDRTDDPYSPRRGARGQFDLEYAAMLTASDFRYQRAAAEAAYFYPLGRLSVIGGRLRAGYVHPTASTAGAVGLDSSASILHPRKRFYAGGANSVRGFGEAQLGPRVLTVPLAKLRADSACASGAPIVECNPNAALLEDRDFDVRPLGGNALLEASVEFRFPILRDIRGAVFLDGAYVAQNTDKTLPKSKAAVTPGFGVRYHSPVGPIRVDVGINPLRTEPLTVVTESDTAGQLVVLTTPRTYSTAKGGFLSRLALHLSIGEAF